MFQKKLTVTIPVRLWRRIVAANAGDEQLAHINLAIAAMVAAENVANPVEPARRRTPPLFLPCEPPTTDHRESLMPPVDLLDANPDSYLVAEGPPVEMPVSDPWGRSWD